MHHQNPALQAKYPYHKIMGVYKINEEITVLKVEGRECPANTVYVGPSGGYAHHYEYVNGKLVTNEYSSVVESLCEIVGYCKDNSCEN
ncbi:hypothetical protein NOVO_06475 [Rickettsiales bacterium Ac37b]|nr:hypothetical protein NOVO_06475 [Rickettsiales bacterium Ac37b]